MSLLLWIVVSIIVYVASFQGDFRKEHIDKAMPFIVVVSLIILLFGIFVSL